MAHGARDGLRDGVTYVATFYNKRAFIPLVVEAMKRQAGDFHREFIFVDDGSTDGSLDLLRDLTGDLHDLVIVTQPNGGPTRAFNRGLALAGTTYVKGLDGDDILAADATLRLLEALRANAECRWAYGAPASYDVLPARLDGLYSASGVPATSRVESDQLRRSLRIPHTNPSLWLAETSLLREIGYCDDAIFIQDYSIELRMAAHAPVAVTSATVSYSHSVIDDRRMMWNQRQTLHDANVAIANLFEQFPRLVSRLRWLAAKRTSGRAWHWARRHEGKTRLSREYADFLAARLRWGEPKRLMRSSCASFGAGLRPAGPDDGDDGKVRLVELRGAFRPREADRAVGPAPPAE